MSFRARLVLAAAYLVTGVVLALVVPLALNVERRADADFQAGVLGRAAILSARVSDLVVTASGSAQAPIPGRLTTLVEESAASVDSRIVVTDDRGRVLADSAGDAGPRELYRTPERPEFTAALQGRIDYRRRQSETVGAELLLVTVPVVQEDRVVGAVRFSTSRASVAASVHESWLRLALIGLAVVAGTLALAWILAGSLAGPLARLRDAAARLGSGDLDARASPEGPKELSAVAASFNRMADQLGSNLRAQRDFVANASHQLRTPLTGVKLRLEAIRAEAGGAAAAHAEKAETEVDRLAELVEDLLELARATTVSATGTTVDLAEIADAAVERWGPSAADAGQTVVAGERRTARVFADPADLAHVVDNLVENALRYCPRGTQITVETASADGQASLLVADNGPGIAPEDRPRVFERFYRGSNGRRSGPGTGLGLAIVAELVARWGGEVRLLDGPGTRVAAVFSRPPADR